MWGCGGGVAPWTRCQILPIRLLGFSLFGCCSEERHCQWHLGWLGHFAWISYHTVSGWGVGGAGGLASCHLRSCHPPSGADRICVCRLTQKEGHSAVLVHFLQCAGALKKKRRERRKHQKVSRLYRADQTSWLQSASILEANTFPIKTFITVLWLEGLFSFFTSFKCLTKKKKSRLNFHFHLHCTL